MMNCEPCGKSFTGLTCYGQHLKSEKHVRKVRTLEMLNRSKNGDVNAAVSNTDELSGQKFKCPPCNMAFSVFADYQFHTLSLLHVTKVQSVASEQNSDSCIVSSSTTDIINENRVLPSYDKINYKEDALISENMYQTSCDEVDQVILPTRSYEMSYTHCKICSKRFSGPESYKQHMESAGHKKKEEMTNALDGKVSDSFRCDVCMKNFSGPVPYDQHMSSEIHKKKLRSLKILEDLNGGVQSKCMSECDTTNNINDISSLDILKDLEKINPWFCKFCKVQCSGYVPYNQHVNGDAHRKRVKKIEIENDLLKQQQHTSTSSAENTNSWQSEIICANYNKTGMSDGLNQEMELNCILPQGLNNLKVMSVDELQLKEFLPDMKIQFDKPENKMEEDSNQDKNGSRELSKGIEENGKNAYQECKYCSVKLMNQDDVISHYESIEHFNKRWATN